MRVKLLTTIAIMVILTGCGPEAPIKTTLSALSGSQKDFDGRLVSVTGKLRTFVEPRHYWIENESLDRVALEGTINFEMLVSQTVKVKGMFRYSNETGRRIEVDELVAVE